MSTAPESLIVCHECDLLNDVPPLAVGEKAFCQRCSYLLTANRPQATTKVFVFALTALVFLVLASSFPFVSFSAHGQEQTVTLIQSIVVLVAQDYPTLALIVFALIVAVPLVLLLGLVYVSLAITLQQSLPAVRGVLRWVLQLVPWSMAEIFLIGILVSFIKIVSLADVALGLSFWSYTLFTVCLLVAVQHLDRRELWRCLRALPRD